jgi:hypothetical protein
VSLTKESSRFGGLAATSGYVAPAPTFTLLDLYERASVSGNTLAAELGLYLYTHDETVAIAMEEIAPTRESVDGVSVHEKALAAILEVVIANSESSIDVVRVPGPQGGVQEWWARMLSGTINESPPTPPALSWR